MFPHKHSNPRASVVLYTAWRKWLGYTHPGDEVAVYSFSSSTTMLEQTVTPGKGISHTGKLVVLMEVKVGLLCHLRIMGTIRKPHRKNPKNTRISQQHL